MAAGIGAIPSATAITSRVAGPVHPASTAMWLFLEQLLPQLIRKVPETTQSIKNFVTI
jgi:hypothetical protein